MRCFLLLAALCAGCSGTPVDTHYYLLRSELPVESRDLAPSKRFAMGAIRVAPYVDQAGLVLEISPGEVRPARYHQWAEPIRGALQNYLLTEISRSLGLDILPASMSEAKTVFELRIDQMHGTASGDALLVAYWWISQQNEEIATYRFSERMALPNDGYAALARAERMLLSELAQRISESLQALDDTEDSG